MTRAASATQTPSVARGVTLQLRAGPEAGEAPGSSIGPSDEPPGGAPAGRRAPAETTATQALCRDPKREKSQADPMPRSILVRNIVFISVLIFPLYEMAISQ